MTDSGLNQRLRQRSRRAGVMIGLSMVFTMAVCVGGFSLLYAALDDPIGDFISRDVAAPVVPTQTPVPEVASSNPGGGDEDEPSGEIDPSGPAPTEAIDEPVEETTPTPSAFTPDYRTTTAWSINLRSEPSRTGGEATIVTLLPPGTALQWTGTDEPATDPEDGDRWMQFRTEDGLEGWIRELDVNPL